MMKLVTFEDIESLRIPPATCMEWVSDSIKRKGEMVLPAKIGLSPKAGTFMNTMPCFVRDSENHLWGGVKLVTRFPNRQPALDSKIILLDAESGEMVALMDADWITAMRTGAVAAHSVETLAQNGYTEVSFIGLGNTARATMLMLASCAGDRALNVRLLRYKDQAELFMERFKEFPNIHFSIVDDVVDLIGAAQVLVSCATYFEDDIAPDDAFGEGILVVPDILANAGGVVVSYFEWVQNIQMLYWDEATANSRLKDIMDNAFEGVWSLMNEHNVSCRMAAYMIAVQRCVEAVKLRGLWP